MFQNLPTISALAHPLFATCLQFQDLKIVGKLRYHIERQLKKSDKLRAGTVCCITSEIYPPFTDSVQLNAGLSLQLFGTNQAQVYVKNFDEFPATYKEKMFKSPESKPIAHLVKTEMNIVNKIANSATDDVVATSSNDEKTIGK